MLRLANTYYQKMVSIIKMEMLSFDGISVTGCTEGCDFDNLWWNKWQKFRQNDDSSISVFKILWYWNKIPILVNRIWLNKFYDYHNVCPTKEHPIWIYMVKFVSISSENILCKMDIESYICWIIINK